MHLTGSTLERVEIDYSYSMFALFGQLLGLRTGGVFVKEIIVVFLLIINQLPTIAYLCTEKYMRNCDLHYT